jgi:hypothetical protein
MPIVSPSCMFSHGSKACLPAALGSLNLYRPVGSRWRRSPSNRGRAAPGRADRPRHGRMPASPRPPYPPSGRQSRRGQTRSLCRRGHRGEPVLGVTKWAMCRAPALLGSDAAGGRCPSRRVRLPLPAGTARPRPASQMRCLTTQLPTAEMKRSLGVYERAILCSHSRMAVCSYDLRLLSDYAAMRVGVRVMSNAYVQMGIRSSVAMRQHSGADAPIRV